MFWASCPSEARLGVPLDTGSSVWQHADIMKEINWRQIGPFSLLFLMGFAGFVAPAWLFSVADLAAKEAPKGLNDWLGFFGNILAALMALLAASIAWIAAQQQIKSARQQSSVLAYETLQTVLRDLSNEEKFLSEVLRTSNEIRLLRNRIRAGITVVQPHQYAPDPRITYQELSVLGDKLEQLIPTVADAELTLTTRARERRKELRALMSSVVGRVKQAAPIFKRYEGKKLDLEVVNADERTVLTMAVNDRLLNSAMISRNTAGYEIEQFHKLLDKTFEAIVDDI